MIRKTLLPADALPFKRGLPLENALQSDDTFWLAEAAGVQVIQIHFDAPQEVTRITLVFEEHLSDRMQEFALSWRCSIDSVWQELRRQQFNFSPPGTTREREDIHFSLKAVAGFKLEINPAVNGAGKAALTCLAIEAEPTLGGS